MKIKDVAVPILSDGVFESVCVAEGSLQGADFCYTTQGACNRGCSFGIQPPVGGGLNLSVPNTQTLNVQISASTAGSVPIDDPFLPACTLSLTIGTLSMDADIGLSIDPATGAFGAELVQASSVGFGNVSASGCPSVSNRAAIIQAVLDELAASWINDAVVPALNAAIGEFMPAESELAALVDLPALALTGPGSSNSSAEETRIVPGGYASLVSNGLSLGIVTGFNSDADPQSRSGAQASEPHACVAGLEAPDLSLPPFALSTSSRGTFVLPPAGAFLGIPDPSDDLLIGVSRSALDLAGHHIAASGGLCLTVDADRAPFVRRDVLDDLLGVPLADEDAELRFVVRPQQPIRFTIGPGTGPSPHLSAVLTGLQIDVEAVSTGTPTPTLRLNADIGVGWQIGPRRDTGLPTRLETMRSALSVANPVVAVFDARYAGVNAADLDVLAGTIADVVFSTLGADAGTVLVSDFAGFIVDGVSVSRVTTANDEFLAVKASLTETPPMIDPPAPMPQPLSTTLELPTPAEVRTALLAGDDAGLPTAHVELPTSDGARPLEHAWRTEGGSWRPYVATGDLVIRDRSFVWQSERTIELRSRVVGNDSTTSATGQTTVVIDWAPPALFDDRMSFDERYLVVPARDAVSTALEWAMGRVGESGPATAWQADPNLDGPTARSLGDDVVVYVRDPTGNVAQATVPLPEPDAVTAMAFGCAALGLLARRRLRRSTASSDALAVTPVRDAGGSEAEDFA